MNLPFSSVLLWLFSFYLQFISNSLFGLCITYIFWDFITLVSLHCMLSFHMYDHGLQQKLPLYVDIDDTRSNLQFYQKLFHSACFHPPLYVPLLHNLLYFKITILYKIHILISWNGIRYCDDYINVMNALTVNCLV